MKYNPYSVSKISSFSTCPRKFYLNYIEKIKVPVSNKALFKGKFIHEILEHNFNYNIDFKTSEVFTDKDKEESIEIVKTFESSPLGQKIKYLINDKDSVLEEDFGIKIDGKYLVLSNFWDNSTFLRGSADLYNLKHKVIIDYKSGKDKSKDPDFGILQAKMYALYLFLKSDIQEVQVIFVFVESCTKKSYKFSRDEYNNIALSIYKEITKIELLSKKEQFKCNISPLCEYCDYNNTYCTAQKEQEEKTKSFLEDTISLDF